MPTVSTPAALPGYFSTMLEQRQSLVNAIAEIDATLARVSSALGIEDVTASIAKPVAIKSVGSAKATAPKAAAAPAKRGRRANASGVSANDFVLGFIRAAKSATTKEVNEAWKKAGRGGSADNALSVLSTKLKQLKRSPAVVNGRKSSKYVLA